MSGLPVEYNAFRTPKRTRSQPLSIEDLHAIPKAKEILINSNCKSQQHHFTPTAMATPNYNWNSFENSSHGRDGNKGRYSNRGGSGGRSNSQLSNSKNNQFNQSRNPNFVPPHYQICNKFGHSVVHCYHRMKNAYQGYQSSQSPFSSQCHGCGI